MGVVNGLRTEQSKLVFAIKVGDHVELRTAREPLKARVSKWHKQRKYKRGVFDDLGRYRYEDSVRTVVLKQVFFIGGKVVGYVPLKTFELMFGPIKVPKDKAVQLEGMNAENVLNPAWRRRHL